MFPLLFSLLFILSVVTHQRVARREKAPPTDELSSDKNVAAAGNLKDFSDLFCSLSLSLSLSLSPRYHDPDPFEERHGSVRLKLAIERVVFLKAQ